MYQVDLFFIFFVFEHLIFYFYSFVHVFILYFIKICVRIYCKELKVWNVP